MRVNIYIESSIKGMRAQNGVVGFVLECDKYPMRTITQFGTVTEVTKNQSYLRGLKYALMRITDKSELVIWADNTYMAAAFEQEWVFNWMMNDFKNAKGEEIANKAEWESILQLLDGNTPSFEIGKSHSYKHWLSQEVERRAQKNG